MESQYPDPEAVGIRIPVSLVDERFRAGFRHGLQGGQLDRVEYMKLSFREGFRASRLYLKALRHSRGILEFPVRWRVRMSAA